MIDVLRTPECLARYKEKRIKLGDTIADYDLTNNPFIKDWNFWVLVENEFPYDRILSKHHLLVPKDKFGKDEEMSDVERIELADIKREIEGDYDAFMENTLDNRTVPHQYHLHCIKYLYITPLSQLQ